MAERKPMSRRKLTTIIIFSVSAFIILVGVVLSGLFNLWEGKSKSNKETNSFAASNFTYNPATQVLNNLTAGLNLDDGVIYCITHDYIAIYGEVISIDALNRKYQLRLSFYPCGKFLTDLTNEKAFQGGTTLLGQNVNITVGPNNLVFPAGKIMQSTETTIQFDDGDVNEYPFDQFVSTTYVVGQYVKNNVSAQLPIGISVMGAIQTWTLNFDAGDFKEDGTAVYVDFKFTRSATTKFFSLFVVVIMWVLGILSFVQAVTIYTRNRKVEPPTIAANMGLLFALPAVRNSQPGAPAIGCLADTVSFFWATVLVSMAVGLLFLNYIIKYKREKPATPPPAAPPTFVPEPIVPDEKNSSIENSRANQFLEMKNQGSEITINPN
ncbi:hypothetical protein HDU76_002357 [Blyttiomyces sp. JEL0837]|nr:hypothetical protein HDU76_002357 [Blyttiomyces sp. JEL0837]